MDEKSEFYRVMYRVQLNEGTPNLRLSQWYKSDFATIKAAQKFCHKKHIERYKLFRVEQSCTLMEADPYSEQC